MAEHFLYLTTTGRKSGLPRQIEIWFVEFDNRYYMISGARERSNWVRNIAHDARVRFSVGVPDDKTADILDTPGTARPIDPAIEPELTRAVSALMDGKYGWSDGLIVEITPRPPV